MLLASTFEKDTFLEDISLGGLLMLARPKDDLSTLGIWLKELRSGDRLPFFLVVSPPLLLSQKSVEVGDECLIIFI